jgi:hypothetical protein
MPARVAKMWHMHFDWSLGGLFMDNSSRTLFHSILNHRVPDNQKSNSLGKEKRDEKDKNLFNISVS